jgi:hypothetical protein
MWSMSDPRRTASPSWPGDEAGGRAEDRTPVSRSQRRVIDLIVQTSGVELFQAYGISAAPMSPVAVSSCELPDDTLGGVVSYSGAEVRGTLVLCVPRKTLQKSIDGSAMSHNERDWVRELANQLMGRIKNRLVRYQILLRPGTPAALEAEGIRRMARTSTDLAYLFRTLTGQVVVWISGDFDRANLVFSSSIDVVNEGDMVLF